MADTDALAALAGLAAELRLTREETCRMRDELAAGRGEFQAVAQQISELRERIAVLESQWRWAVGLGGFLGGVVALGGKGVVEKWFFGASAAVGVDWLFSGAEYLARVW